MLFYGVHKNIGCMIALMALVGFILGAWLVFDWYDPFNDATFTSAAWKNCDQEDRARMARDLVGNHLPTGFSRSETEALLGPPDEVLDKRFDSGGNLLRGAETFCYYIGSWSFYGFDDAFVYVFLDPNGGVVASEINGY